MGRLRQNRGYRWERENAERYGAERMGSGQGDDVRILIGRHLIHLECKSQQDYDGLMKLLHWTDQAKSYGEKWALAIKLGLRTKRREFVVMSPELFSELLDALRKVEDAK